MEGKKMRTPVCLKHSLVTKRIKLIYISKMLFLTMTTFGALQASGCLIQTIAMTGYECS